MSKATDFTGIAYLTALAGAAAVAWWVYKQGFVSVRDAATSAGRTIANAVNPVSPENVVNQGATAAVSAVAGRPTSIGSLVADMLPSKAEQIVNAQGYWVNPGKRPSMFNFWDSTDGNPEPFNPPPFVAPPAPNNDTALYDAMGNRIY